MESPLRDPHAPTTFTTMPRAVLLAPHSLFAALSPASDHVVSPALAGACASLAVTLRKLLVLGSKSMHPAAANATSTAASLAALLKAAQAPDTPLIIATVAPKASNGSRAPTAYPSLPQPPLLQTATQHTVSPLVLPAVAAAPVAASAKATVHAPAVAATTATPGAAKSAAAAAPGGAATVAALFKATVQPTPGQLRQGSFQ
ncbi:MAG: hypothetical protein WDW36_000116 [Sanguina aurantia]